MKVKKIAFFMLLLAVSLLFCGLVSSFMNYRLFDINNFGFQFLYFAVLGCIVYITLSKLRLFDTIALSVILGIIFAFIMSRTDLITVFGSFLYIILYAIALFVVYTVCLRFLWFNNAGYLRNIVFSLAAAFGYTLVHIITHLFLRTGLRSDLIMNYFVNGLLIMITISSAFSVTELIFAKIEPIFFGHPGQSLNDEKD